METQPRSLGMSFLVSIVDNHFDFFFVLLEEFLEPFKSNEGSLFL